MEKPIQLTYEEFFYILNRYFSMNDAFVELNKLLEEKQKREVC